MEEETVYKIETTDKREMLLMLNATRMAQVLYDLMCWYRAIYNGKDYGGHIFFKDKLYTHDEWFKVRNLEEDIVKDEDRDENGYIKSELYAEVYTKGELEHKLEDILEDINDFIYRYYE